MPIAPASPAPILRAALPAPASSLAACADVTTSLDEACTVDGSALDVGLHACFEPVSYGLDDDPLQTHSMATPAAKRTC